MSEVLMAVIFDSITGEAIERPLTEEEIVYGESMQADQELRDAERTAKEEAKANGIVKLIALGLTEEEAGALIG